MRDPFIIIIKLISTMGGDHHIHIVYNEQAMKESDEDMKGKIQRIDLIKFNPNMFHFSVFDMGNNFQVLGGAPAASFGVLGAALSYGYYSGQARRYNHYANVTRSFGRIAFGFALGMSFGIYKFGDRQRIHNAYVAERLRRRYPESLELHETDLWRCKGVSPPHEYYRWQ